MADTKVSALVSASTLNVGDFLMLVQGGTSMKVDLATLAQKMPSRVQIVEVSETPVSGALATNLLVSKIACKTAGNAYTLAAGTHGMEKYIVVASADVTTPAATLTITGGSGFTTASFSDIRDCLYLKNIDGLWFIASQNSIIIA